MKYRVTLAEIPSKPGDEGDIIIGFYELDPTAPDYQPTLARIPHSLEAKIEANEALRKEMK